jgi:pyruvate/2-oxoglutarate dehydrogenase complex dihydrolipoamide dehydrogenase (E3) component
VILRQDEYSVVPCHAAGEIISTVQMVMQAQMPYPILRDGVLTHPTMTEGLNMLFSKA